MQENRKKYKKTNRKKTTWISWRKITTKSLPLYFNELLNFCTSMTSAQLVTYASSSAFFLFLSLVPMIIVICSVLPFTPVPKIELVDALCRLVPEELHSLVSNLVSYIYNVRGGVISISALLAMWSGSAAMMSLINGFNAILGIADGRNWFHRRFVAVFYTMTLIVSTIVIMVLEVFYTPILSLIEKSAPPVASVISSFMSHRHLIVWVFMTLAIALIYRFVPGKRNISSTTTTISTMDNSTKSSTSRVTYISMLPAAALAAFAWSACSRLFAIYLDFANFTIYGSLAVVVILLLWMYVCMIILMFCLYLGEYRKTTRH